MIHYSGQTVLKLSTMEPVVILQQKVDPNGDYYTALQVMDKSGKKHDLSPTDVGPAYVGTIEQHARAVFHGPFCCFKFGQREVKVNAEEVKRHLAEAEQLLKDKTIRAKTYSS